MAGSTRSRQPYIEILEQPHPRSHRFRYEREVEGRSAGAIVGIHSSAGARTYPTIKVRNYSGPCYVVVSCVTADGPPYRPHPHRLIGQNCNGGYFRSEIENPDMTYSFTGLGIECVKKKDVKDSLEERKKHGVDPFGTKFNHQNGINLSVLRLCFQVFIPKPNTYFTLQPVVSAPIRDKKAVMSNLNITKLSHYSAPVTGGDEVILLCERISRTDVQIWFFEIQNSRVVWEAKADFGPTDVHKQVAISFRTPPYRDQNILHPVEVYIQLGWSEEQERGDPISFQFHPRHRDMLPIKRRRIEDMINSFRCLQDPRSSDGAASQIPCELTYNIPSPRTRQQQKVKYEAGRSGALRDSYPPASTTTFGEGTRDATSQTQPVARPSTSFETPVSKSTAFTVHSESPGLPLGLSDAVINSFPQTSSLLEARMMNIALQIEESAASTAFAMSSAASGRSGGLRDSYPPASTTTFGEGTRDVTSQTQPVARPSTSFEVLARSTAFAVPSESPGMPLGLSDAVSNSLPQTSSLLEARMVNLALQIEESAASTAFAMSSAAPGFYPVHNHPLPPQPSFVGEWISNLTSQTNPAMGPSASLLQTHDSSAFNVSPESVTMSPEFQCQSPETSPSISTSPMNRQQFELPEINLNFQSENCPDEDDSTSFLLSGLSSIALDYDISRNLNINQNLPVDSLES